MQAIAKNAPRPGLELIAAKPLSVGPGMARVRVHYGSICGTDIHIYNWDAWSSARIQPPRIIGHEFSGVVEEVGEGVSNVQVGDRVASESHITCGTCRQCKEGQANVCVNAVIVGVDVDGGFIPSAVVDSRCLVRTADDIPLDLACIQDPLGNAVHTVFSGPVEGQDLLITGMGPIGLFALGVSKAAGARSVAVTEVSPYRLELAEKMGADVILNPQADDVIGSLDSAYPGGVDGALEMSGHPDALEVAIQATRPGGRISLLGIFSDTTIPVSMNDVIFKGLDIHAIIGRQLWSTWDKMSELMRSGNLDLWPLITHRFDYRDFEQAFETVRAGLSGKVILEFDPAGS